MSRGEQIKVLYLRSYERMYGPILASFQTRLFDSDLQFLPLLRILLVPIMPPDGEALCIYIHTSVTQFIKSSDRR